jgi:hypothetical protein
MRPRTALSLQLCHCHLRSPDDLLLAPSCVPQATYGFSEAMTGSGTEEDAITCAAGAVCGGSSSCWCLFGLQLLGD